MRTVLEFMVSDGDDCDKTPPFLSHIRRLQPLYFFIRDAI
jgi:hypothetical protein